jgi:hypothetical protein
MYLIISWDISAENPLWREINEELRNCLENYQWTRPVYTFYLVRLPAVASGSDIKNKIDAVRARHPDISITYILSPVFVGKQGFVGSLAKTQDWSEVNLITGGD